MSDDKAREPMQGWYYCKYCGCLRSHLNERDDEKSPYPFCNDICEKAYDQYGEEQ